MLMLCGRLLRLAAGAVKSAEATRRLTLMAVIAAVSHPSPLSSSRQRSTWNACSRRTIMRSSLVIANLHKYSSKTERNKPTLADPCPGYVGASDCPRGSMEAALARRCTLSCFDSVLPTGIRLRPASPVSHLEDMIGHARWPSKAPNLHPSTASSTLTLTVKPNAGIGRRNCCYPSARTLKA